MTFTNWTLLELLSPLEQFKFIARINTYPEREKELMDEAFEVFKKEVEESKNKFGGLK